MITNMISVNGHTILPDTRSLGGLGRTRDWVTNVYQVLDNDRCVYQVLDKAYRVVILRCLRYYFYISEQWMP